MGWYPESTRTTGRTGVSITGTSTVMVRGIAQVSGTSFERTAAMTALQLAYTAGGVSRASWSVTTSSATSWVSTLTSLAVAFRLYGVFTHYEALASSGISIILDHASGSTWDTVIGSSTLSSEKDASYIPSAPVIVPAGYGIKVWTQAPKVTGCTRHITVVVGY